MLRVVFPKKTLMENWGLNYLIMINNYKNRDKQQKYFSWLDCHINSTNLS